MRSFLSGSILSVCLVAAGQGLSGAAYAEDGAAGKWTFLVAPYLLAPTISGDAKIGRLPTTTLNVSPGTIFENLHLGAMGHFEALYDDRFGIAVDVAYMNLGSGKTFPAVGGSVKANVKQTVSEVFAGYRVWKQDKNWVEAYVGGRWWINELGVRAALPANAFSHTITESWVDPVIGVRGQALLSDDWSLYGSANIGGFGVASDFTWGLQAGVGYHFSESLSAQLQYKATAVDYDNGKSGADAFSYNTITHGPMAGLVFRF